ncbi:hypothetical protein FRAHR75_1100008 [Frankia sp. Hr75.2]|nr:hypothetical protein FRAHR75_1100008 [Frankia sp. Hr75.2]
MVDLRSRKAFAHRHLTGTLSLGLDGPMSTWLGWLMSWGMPVTLLGESDAQIGQAQRELARIGIDRPAAAATGTPEQWAAGDQSRLGPLPAATYPELAAALAGRPPRGLPAPDVVLDVRLRNEWRNGHLAGAVHIPLPELPGRIGEVPGEAVWVYCGSGYRVAAAASLLVRAGRTAAFIDDSYTAAADAGLPIVSGEGAE